MRRAVSRPDQALPCPALPCPVELCTAPSCRYLRRLVNFAELCPEAKKSLGQEAVFSDLVVLQYMCLRSTLSVCVCSRPCRCQDLHRMRILPPSAVLPPFGWPRSGQVAGEDRHGQGRLDARAGWAGWAGMPVVKGGLMSWQGRRCLLVRPIGLGRLSPAQRVGASCCKDKGCRAHSGHWAASKPSPDNLNRSSCYFEVVTACTEPAVQQSFTTHHLDSP